MFRTHSSFTKLVLEVLQERALLTAIYINSLTGDDTFDGLSPQTAWRSTVNVGYRSEGADIAPRPFHLQQGDSINFINGAGAAPYYSGHDFGWQYLFLRNVHGSKDQHVVVRGLDGPTLSVSAPNRSEMSMVYLLQSSFIDVETVAFQGGYGSTVMIAAAQNITVRDVSIRGADGAAENNLAGIHIVGGHDVEVVGCFIYDVYDRSKPGNQNNRPIVVFGSTNIKIVGNALGYTDVGLGFGVEYKHLGSLPASEALAHPMTVSGNVIENATHFGISSAAPAVIEGNLVINGGIRLADIGGTSLLSGQFVRHNTIVNTHPSARTGSLYYAPTQYPGFPIGNVEFVGNLIHDQREYSTGETNTLELNRYGRDSDYVMSIEAGLFKADRNVYSTLATPRFDIFGADGRYNTVGGIYDFSQWQSQGFDANGAVRDMLFDEFYTPNTNVAAGWQAGSTPRLTMIAAARMLDEGGTQRVRVARSGVDISVPLILSLSSNAPGRVTLPSTMTIPAGSNYADLLIRGVSNTIENDDRAVQIKVTATGLSASTWIDLADTPPANDDLSGIFQIPNSGRVSLETTLKTQNGEYRSEMGFAIVDDDRGTVGGHLAGTSQWLSELLSPSRTRTLVSAGSEVADKTTVEALGGSHIVFYMVQNATLENWRSSNPGNSLDASPIVFTSIGSTNFDQFDHLREEMGQTWTLAWEDLVGGGDQSFTDLVAEIEFTEIQSGNALLSYRFQLSDSDGQQIQSVCVGEPFYVDVFATDNRPEALGLFSAALDVEFTPGLADVTGPLVYGPAFPSFQTGLRLGNQIDELGGVSTLAGAPSGSLVARIPMTARAEGRLAITGNAADDRVHQSTLVGLEEALTGDAIRYESVELLIKADRYWHNAELAEDVNGDGYVSPMDALHIINRLNSPSQSRNLYADAVDILFEGKRLDVNEDGMLSPIDALLVINRLNSSLV